MPAQFFYRKNGFHNPWSNFTINWNFNNSFLLTGRNLGIASSIQSYTSTTFLAKRRNLSGEKVWALGM